MHLCSTLSLATFGLNWFLILDVHRFECNARSLMSLDPHHFVARFPWRAEGPSTTMATVTSLVGFHSSLSWRVAAIICRRLLSCGAGIASGWTRNYDGHGATRSRTVMACSGGLDEEINIEGGGPLRQNHSRRACPFLLYSSTTC
jgi:hypothetical protein